MKQLMLGNEAVARGAYEAGCGFGSGYPGTPSTEILEYLCSYEGVRVQWGTNEKVGLEVGMGAVLAGVRSLVTMKHVGLNVAADPFFCASYIGVNAGLVVISADDPGMHSSQNEQDNRWLAKAAKVIMVEPADPEESRWMTREAFELSERFDGPVLVRMTTRVCHQTGVVNVEAPADVPRRAYQKNAPKYVMLPGHARLRRPLVEERLRGAEAWANESDRWNPVFPGESDVGVITSGVAFGYVREALPAANVLKLGLTYPLPLERIKKFAASMKKIFVIEEVDPYLEEHVRAAGVPVEGLKLRPYTGELNLTLVERMLRGEPRDKVTVSLADLKLPVRPPTLCPGCGHRPLFKVLRDLKVHVMGDIGCYTLGALKPLDAMHSCMCMGASLGMTEGLDRFGGENVTRHTVAVIGDSTFFHSGITPLIDMVVNGSEATVLILDNGITAMTGAQPHPGTGLDIRGAPAPKVAAAAVCRGVGVKRVVEVDAYDMKRLEAVIREELAAAELSVVVVQAPCVLAYKVSFGAPVEIDLSLCDRCGACIRVGCMALRERNGYPEVNPDLCNGCGVCVQVCPPQGIRVPAKVAA